MIKFIDVTGKTEDEAIRSALAQLGMDRKNVLHSAKIPRCRSHFQFSDTP